MMGWDTAIYFLIASIVISVALMPKMQPTPPAAFGDFEFPQADEGTPQAVFFGDCHSTDWTVLSVGNYQSQAISGSGGKK
jgi:hypothetical protein